MTFVNEAIKLLQVRIAELEKQHQVRGNIEKA
jgi:hypothetical protein